MGHITQTERIKIGMLKKLGYSQSYIAEEIGRSQSTISREIKRNSSEKTKIYNGNRAHKRAVERRKKGSKRKRWIENKSLYKKILYLLQDGKSPEQACGFLKKTGETNVPSCQSIYSYIRADKYAGGKLYTLLRYQGKKYKWRGFKKDKTRIPNRKDISLRPEIVQQKARYGDWESDLVVSCRKGSGAIATFVERKSMYLCAELVADKSAAEMKRATQKALGRFPKAFRRTMTHDNGREISQHEAITDALDMDIYCARPYRSCDRALNEWMNRELRRFFPKGTDFSTITPTQLASAVSWLNNCPRKSLNFHSPHQIMRFVV